MSNIKVTFPESLGGAFLVVLWVMGIAIEKGFWLVSATMIFPPYAWYVAVQHFMKYFGVL